MAIYNVSNASELAAALAKASGGDEIRLAGGNYGDLDLGSKAQFSSEVTITSADPDAPASFSGLRLDGSSNITFDSVVFDYVFNGEDENYSPFRVDGSSHILFENCLFDGDLADGVSAAENGRGNGRALRIFDSNDVTVNGCEVREFWKGITGARNTDIAITNTEIHSMRSDGMTIGASDGVLIEGNYLHDWHRADVSDHADMIQFGKNDRDGASTDVTIRGNVFDMGAGDNTQTLFMGGDGTSNTDPNMFHKNVLIEGNVIYNAHTHGITISTVDGLVIRENSVLTVPYGEPAGVRTPSIHVHENSTNVLVEKNITSSISGYEDQSDWTLRNNAEIKPEEYDSVFVYHATGEKDGYNQFGIKPGSIVDKLGAGSGIMDLYPTPYEAGGLLDGYDDGEEDSVPDILDDIVDNGGNEPVDEGGNEEPADNEGDGGTEEPVDNGGEEPTDNGGDDEPVDEENVDESSDFPSIPENMIVDFVLDDFVLDIAAGLENNDQIYQANGDVYVTFDGTEHAIVMNEVSNDGNVRLGRLTEFEQSEHLAFRVKFAREAADGSEQRLVWNHKKLGLTLEDDGLIVKVGDTEYEVKDIGLNDTETHEFTVLVNQAVNRLQVIVDDQIVLDETEMEADFVGRGGHEWGWNLGTRWGREVNGTVSDFRIDDDLPFAEREVEGTISDFRVDDDLPFIETAAGMPELDWFAA